MPLLAEQVTAVTGIALEDLLALWQITDVDDVTAAMFDLLPPLIDTWSAAAGALAADWYDTQREDKNIGGSFTAIIPNEPDKGANALAGWASDALHQAVPDWALARDRVEGGVQRRVADTARQTVMVSAVADPQARGWQRVAHAGACGFCQMLAGRGAVYSEKNVDFGAHDHCSCSVAPAWGGHPNPVKPYTPSDQVATDADRARVRKWIADNL